MFIIRSEAPDRKLPREEYLQLSIVAIVSTLIPCSNSFRTSVVLCLRKYDLLVALYTLLLRLVKGVSEWSHIRQSGAHVGSKSNLFNILPNTLLLGTPSSLHSYIPVPSHKDILLQVPHGE